MKQQQPSSQANTSQLNLADTLAAGFSLFLRRFFVILIPIIIDIWLIWGGNIYPQAMAERIQELLVSTQTWSEIPLADTNRISEQIAQTDTRRYGAVVVLFPSLALTSKISAVNESGITLDSIWAVIGLIIGLNIGLIWAAACFFQPLGDALAGRSGWSIKRTARSFWSMLRLFGLGAVVLLFGILPLFLSSLGLFASSQIAIQLGLGFTIIWMFTIWLLCSFCVEAIIVGEASPLVAIYQSYHIVRSNLRAAMVLHIALWILMYGFGFLLQPLLTTTAGIFGAIGVYAILSGSVVAAQMVFYHDRIAHIKRTVPVFFAHE